MRIGTRLAGHREKIRCAGEKFPPDQENHESAKKSRVERGFFIIGRMDYCADELEDDSDELLIAEELLVVLELLSVPGTFKVGILPSFRLKFWMQAAKAVPRSPWSWHCSFLS